MPKPPPPSSAMAAVKDFDLPDDDMFYQLKQQRLRESPLCNQQISCQLVEEHSLPIQLKCTHHIQCAPEEVCVCVALFPGPIPSVSMLKRLGSLGDEAMCVCVGILWISLISSFFPCPPPFLQVPQSERTDGKLIVKGDGSFAVLFSDSLAFYRGTSTDHCYSHSLSKVCSLLQFI